VAVSNLVLLVAAAGAAALWLQRARPSQGRQHRGLSARPCSLPYASTRSRGRARPSRPQHEELVRGRAHEGAPQPDRRLHGRRERWPLGPRDRLEGRDQAGWRRSRERTIASRRRSAVTWGLPGERW